AGRLRGWPQGWSASDPKLRRHAKRRPGHARYEPKFIARAAPATSATGVCASLIGSAASTFDARAASDASLRSASSSASVIRCLSATGFTRRLQARPTTSNPTPLATTPCRAEHELPLVARTRRWAGNVASRTQAVAQGTATGGDKLRATTIAEACYRR